MNINEWRCDICKSIRPDDKVDVVSYQMKDCPEATINLKYCNDNWECIKKAEKFEKEQVAPWEKIK
jgi:hypothetical protein